MKPVVVLAFLLLLTTAACTRSTQRVAQDDPEPGASVTAPDLHEPGTPPMSLAIRQPGDGWTRVHATTLRYEHATGMTLSVEHYPNLAIPPATAAGRSALQLWLHFDSGHKRPTTEVSADGAYALFTTRLPEKAGKITVLVIAFRRLNGLPGLVRVAGATTDERQLDTLTAAVRAGATTLKTQ